MIYRGVASATFEIHKTCLVTKLKYIHIKSYKYNISHILFIDQSIYDILQEVIVFEI